jgi:predicted metal-dependent phosphoesterase TrpH
MISPDQARPSRVLLMSSKREIGRRKFLASLALGAAGVAAASRLGRWSIRASNRHLKRSLERLALGRKAPAPLPGLLDLQGAIHVHTLISPDSRGTPEEILRAAREAGLQFLFTTDHNRRRIFSEGIQGRFEDLRVIRGAEMIKGGQTILAVAIKKFIDGHRMSIQAAVREIKAQGGLAFVAHPWRFREWDVEGIDGIEIYDIADAAYAQAWKAPWMALEMLSSWDDYPEEVLLTLLSRPGHHLSTWDRLLARRRLVGIAGNDAHQNVRFLGMQLDPYALDFRYVQTHLLAASAEEPSLLEALGSGHAYVSFGILADATGFQFVAEHDGVGGIMGDRVAPAPGLTLTLQAPLAGWIRLYRDGVMVREDFASRLDHSVTERGIYRAEVFLQVENERYPWILSNPIHVG